MFLVTLNSVYEDMLFMISSHDIISKVSNTVKIYNWSRLQDCFKVSYLFITVVQLEQLPSTIFN